VEVQRCEFSSLHTLNTLPFAKSETFWQCFKKWVYSTWFWNHFEKTITCLPSASAYSLQPSVRVSVSLYLFLSIKLYIEWDEYSLPILIFFCYKLTDLEILLFLFISQFISKCKIWHLNSKKMCFQDHKLNNLFKKNELFNHSAALHKSHRSWQNLLCILSSPNPLF
jgi:hypothetical protein